MNDNYVTVTKSLKTMKGIHCCVVVSPHCGNSKAISSKNYCLLEEAGFEVRFEGHMCDELVTFLLENHKISSDWCWMEQMLFKSLLFLGTVQFKPIKLHSPTNGCANRKLSSGIWLNFIFWVTTHPEFSVSKMIDVQVKYKTIQHNLASYALTPRAP